MIKVELFFAMSDRERKNARFIKNMQLYNISRQIRSIANYTAYELERAMSYPKNMTQL
ncbi:hypothetical protein [Fischerella muscicola]|uniref:hypothetical protein n=1 Tax=Fischerella muscicola TaxID=92938 RepID=UPI00138B0C26|nr:hypothetical protein [Fischerella muscicola]